MAKAGVGTKTGRRMGHVPISGEDGSMARLSGLASRKVYFHINNTNPILLEGSPERALVEANGYEIAEDGLEISV
jgi:pyrroloquinoline quinone biosynthesis protein B